MSDLSPVSHSEVVERRSTRLTAHPVMLAGVPDDDMQVDSEYENLAESSSRGKKRKAQKRKSREDKVNPQAKKFRGQRGLLRRLVEMPLDVLFEVCATLHLSMD